MYLNREDVSIEKEPFPKGRDLYPGFLESDFLDGAEKAFLMVLQAYYQKKEDILRKLVDKNLVQRFFFQKTSPEDIPEVELLSAHIQSKEVKGHTAFVVVHFVSLQKRKDKEEELDDIWTFQKNLSSRSPNWTVCAIDFENNSKDPKGGSIDPSTP